MSSKDVEAIGPAEGQQDALDSSIGYFGGVKHVVGNSEPHAEQDEHDLYAAPRELGWRTVGVIQIGDVVGIGVLTLASAFVQLGWALGLVLAIFGLVLNLYVGYLLSLVRNKLPRAVSYATAAKLSWGNRYFCWLVKVSFYVYLVLNLGGYTIAVGEALKELFFEWSTCQPISSAVAVVCVLVPMQLRTFGEAKILMWLNAALIFVAVALCLGYMCANMSERIQEATYVPPEPIASNLTRLTFFSGFTKILFAYLGAYIYFEMMAEMRHPKEFPKSFMISAPFQFCIYAAVGLIAGFYMGPANATDSILKAIDPATNPALVRVAALALVIHVIISFCIKGTVLCRNLHLSVSPATVNERSMKASLVWLGCTLALTLSTYLIANVIPGFGNLTALLGGFFAPLLQFLFPVLFYIGAMRGAGEPISRISKLTLSLVALISLLVMVAGTMSNIQTMIDAAQTSGSPFQCTYTSYMNSTSF